VTSRPSSVARDAPRARVDASRGPHARERARRPLVRSIASTTRAARDDARVCDARDARSRRRSIDRSRRRRVQPRCAYVSATTNLERRFDGARDRAIAADAARATDDSARRTATRDRVNALAIARADAKKSSGARDRV